ncbi:hypothetical protein MKX03_005159 [Papaver bracteatum]|nr:hypothetical protein MKX03_005159 [Papaver bracteatum]
MGKMKNLPHRVSSIAGPKSVRGGLKTLSTMLAAAFPQNQKQMLGEYIYPLVFQLQCDLATKLTGMLLEMDNLELLLLILESPESLATKAGKVLNSSKLQDSLVHCCIRRPRCPGKKKIVHSFSPRVFLPFTT